MEGSRGAVEVASPGCKARAGEAGALQQFFSAQALELVYGTRWVLAMPCGDTETAVQGVIGEGASRCMGCSMPRPVCTQLLLGNWKLHHSPWGKRGRRLG